MTDKSIIKTLIQNSPVLSDLEREEWLTLLPLMNDKQIQDLESLLGTDAKPQQAKPTPVESATPVASPPKIISTQTPMASSYINSDPRVEKRTDTNPPPLPNPVPLSKPTPAYEGAFARGMQQVAQPKKVPFTARPTPTQITPPPQIQKQVVTQPFHTPSTPQVQPQAVTPQGFQLLKPIDVTKIPLEAIQNEKFPDLSAKLKNFCLSYGYHNILILLRHSPLFQKYLEYGTNKLNLKADNALSTAEFDEITDLLIELRSLPSH